MSYIQVLKDLFKIVLNTEGYIKISFNKLKSPEDSYIYRKTIELCSPSPADSYIYERVDVRVRWTRGNRSFANSINVQVLWTC
jgi:hypothetical protein